jgi:hypothetical protein
VNASGLAALVVAVTLSGCLGGVAVEESVGTDDFGPEELVECRVLGGNTVYTEYSDGEGSSSKGVQEGIPKGKRHSAIGETTIETNPRKLRAQKAELRANGWDDDSIRDLVALGDDYEMARSSGFTGSEAEFNARKRELQARLERMPSCLEEARGKAGDR